jgi:hypothetical protein
MPPAPPPPGKETTTIDPTWINAASSVIGAALTPAPAGPSRSDTGGLFDFGAPFIVTTGPGGASLQPLSSAAWWLLVAAAVGFTLWKLARKSS